MTPGYAAGTTVSVEKSRAELERLLAHHGAEQRAFFVDDVQGIAQIGFVIRGRKYRLDVPMPKRIEGMPKPEPRGWWQWGEVKREEWRRRTHEQACRERWRGMVLLLKAKLEIVRMGMSTVEKEFLADMLTENGVPLHQRVAEAIKRSFETGVRTPLLLGENT